MSKATDPLRRLRALAARRPGAKRLRSGRGAAEVSVVVVSASLIAGVLFGNGLTRTSVDIADGLTWFGDDPSGEVIQVNPATGEPEVRIKVGERGDELSVAQWDGRMVVTNRTTGELTSWDLSGILASGQRRVATGDDSDVLHHGDDMFLVDRDRGTLAAVDPVSTDAIGEMWSSPGGIADAAVDERGRIWAIDESGTLSELRWSAGTDGGTFVVEDERHIDHSGARSVLVGHERGVTVFGADAGIVVQVGTGHDVVADAMSLSGELAAPDSSPADLAPVASPQTSTVAIVGEDRVVEVGLADVGCEKPATPQVFEGVVYVPCPGDGKVVRLAADGTRADEDIDVADNSDPQLVLDDGQLLINVPGDAHGTVVHAGGEIEQIVRYDEDLPTLSAGGMADVPAPPTPETVTQAVEQDTTPPPPVVDQDEADETDEEESDPQVCALGVVCISTNGPDDADDPDDGSTDGPNGNGGGKGPDRGPDGDGDQTDGPDDHGDGDGDGDDHQPPTPDPLEAPTRVTGVEMPDGTVRVSWQHTGTPATDFQVEEVDGEIEQTVSGSYRQASVEVDPGEHRFIVTALRYGQPARTSAPSATVTTSGRPGAVSDIEGSATGNEVDNTAAVAFAWQPAEDNGSPIIRYDITVTDTVTGTFTMQSTTTSASYTAVCQATYCDPGPVRVTITPVNAKGTGPAVSDTLAYDGPTAPPLPKPNQRLATSQRTSWYGLGYDGNGSTTLTLAPPADWSGFQGTCSWVHKGNSYGDETGTFPCDATSVKVPIRHGWVKQGESPVRKHSIQFTAASTQGSVTSQTYAWEFRQPVPNS